jgi:toxin secretion/phage lysis holin
MRNFWEYTILPALWAIAGAVSWLLGGFDKMIQTLIFFVVVDYILGMFAAMKEGKWSAKVAVDGFLKKLLYFAVVAVAVQLDKALFSGGEPAVVVGFICVRTLAIFYLVSIEGLSICVNFGRLGVPFPPQMMAAFVELKDKIGLVKIKPKLPGLPETPAEPEPLPDDAARSSDGTREE